MKQLIRKIRRKLAQFLLRIYPKKPATALDSRMTLAIREDAQGKIQNLMDEAELRDPAILFNRALDVLKLLTEHISLGGKVVLQYPDGTKRILDPLSFKWEDDSDE